MDDTDANQADAGGTNAGIGEPGPEKADGDVRAVRWGLPTAFGSLLSFLAASALLGMLLMMAGVDPVAASVTATLIGWLGLAGWPVLASLRRGAGPASDLAVRFRPVDLAIGLGAFVVLMIAASVFVAVYLQITGDMPTSALGTAAEGSTRVWQLVLLGLLALGASVVEEVHFRGMWWNVLRRKGLGPWATLLVTSLLFAVIHVEPQRVVLLFVAGFVIGFVRMRTDRLGPAVIAHLFVNGVGVIGLFTAL